MAAKLAVDKEAFRVLALAIGIRPAARQMGINPATALGWAHEGKWLADCRPTPAKLPAPATMQSPPAAVTPGQAMGKALAELGGQTKVHLAQAAANAAEHAASLPGGEALDASRALKELASTGAILHGWREGQNEGNALVNINLVGVQLPAVERNVIDCEPA